MFQGFPSRLSLEFTIYNLFRTSQTYFLLYRYSTIRGNSEAYAKLARDKYCA